MLYNDIQVSNADYDLLLFKKNYNNCRRNKLLRCCFKHAFSEITTTINTAAIGNIEAISDGVITPNYASANVKISDYFNTDNTVNANNIIWNGSAGSASVKFTGSYSRCGR